MYWLLLSILANTTLLLILKSFTRFGVNTLQAIVINYFVAGLTGIFISGIPFSISEIPQQAWWWIPLILGLLFISIFLLIAKTAQTLGVSVTTVANKMSLVIPVLAAVFIYGESISTFKIIGLVVAMIAVYFTSVPSKKEEHQGKHHLWMPALIFIGSGIIDALVNHAKTRKVVPDSHMPFFISLSFLVAGIIGILIISIRISRTKEKIQGKSILAGIILGIPNYFSIYGITKALGSNIMESSALYPVNNMGIVALSAIAALFVFKEKFSILNWIGILLSLGAIALIAFS